MSQSYNCTEYAVTSEQLQPEHVNEDAILNSSILAVFPHHTYLAATSASEAECGIRSLIDKRTNLFLSELQVLHVNHKESIRPALVLRYYTSRHVGSRTFLFVPLQGDAVQARRQWSAPGGPGGAQDSREAATLGWLPGQQ